MPEIASTWCGKWHDDSHLHFDETFNEVRVCFGEPVRCFLCEETFRLNSEKAEMAPDPPEGAPPRADNESHLVHSDCGIAAGWELA